MNFDFDHPLRVLSTTAFLAVAMLGWHCSNVTNPTDGIASVAIPQHPSFNFDIRPILSNNCYLCHGPDVSSREADLRLDLKEGLTAELDGGRSVIVPGNPEKSELLHRVRSHDPDYRMPPPSQKRILSDREVEILERWIKQGAKWEPYWAFVPPAKASIPGSQSLAEEIDYLLHQKLDESDLPSAAQANHAM